jgi:excinuclease ABC subunit C
VAALGRVLPLAHAGELSLASERELARARGVAPGDRAALLAAVRGVLGRDPDAVGPVCTVLADLRDAAVAELAFERAARRQAELDALAWLVAEQKVATADPADHDVAGFAGGVLVQFGIRGGRVRTWSQRACSPRSAEAALAATPPEWAGFAERAARLAAALAAGPRPVSAAAAW